MVKIGNSTFAELFITLTSTISIAIGVFYEKPPLWGLYLFIVLIIGIIFTKFTFSIYSLSYYQNKFIAKKLFVTKIEFSEEELIDIKKENLSQPPIAICALKNGKKIRFKLPKWLWQVENIKRNLIDNLKL